MKPRDLVLSEDAAALWIAFFNEVERQQAPGGELADARPFASKAAEHAARIAAVMTLVENHDARTVPVNTMDGAIQATTFYIGEHLRLTGAGREHRNLKELRGLWDWLRGKDVLGNSELLQKSPRSIRRLKPKREDQIDPRDCSAHARPPSGKSQLACGFSSDMPTLAETKMQLRIDHTEEMATSPD